MGVTSGGLAGGEHQDITIEIPSAPGNTESGEMAKELQQIIDTFNSEFGDKVEVL